MLSVNNPTLDGWPLIMTTKQAKSVGCCVVVVIEHWVDLKNTNPPF